MVDDLKSLVKYRFDEQTIAKLLAKQWWNGDAEEIESLKETYVGLWTSI